MKELFIKKVEADLEQKVRKMISIDTSKRKAEIASVMRDEIASRLEDSFKGQFLKLFNELYSEVIVETTGDKQKELVDKRLKAFARFAPYYPGVRMYTDPDTGQTVYEFPEV